MNLAPWQFVCLVWIALCVAGAVVASYLDVIRDRRALLQPPAADDQLLNAGGPCKCRDCLLEVWRR